MNETLKVLETRRSCRKFKNDMLPEEDYDVYYYIARVGRNKDNKFEYNGYFETYLYRHD